MSALPEKSDAESERLSLAHFRDSTTMTNSLAALKALDGHPGAARDEVSSTFYARAKANSEALVINKWFAVQASTYVPDALQRVQALMAHEAYDGTNPNRVRAVISTFAALNPAAFHASDGAGYAFIADQVLDLGQLGLSPDAMVEQLARALRRELEAES